MPRLLLEETAGESSPRPTMVILGVNAFHGDASAAVIVDGKLVAAAEEERFTRIKHTAGFPAEAVRYCLAAAGARLQDTDHVAIPRRRSARILRKAYFALKIPRLGLDRARAWGRFGDIRTALARTKNEGPDAIQARLHYVEHHVAHMASSFYVSPFARAAVLSLDGLGDFASGMWGLGEGNRLRAWGSVAFPHSIGLGYTAVTQHLGFWKYGDEYKVMGLAAYGQPVGLHGFRDIVSTNGGMGYRLSGRGFTGSSKRERGCPHEPSLDGESVRACRELIAVPIRSGTTGLSVSGRVQG